MSQYRNYNPEQLENLFSQFLIDSWSYSKVTQFARNEKAFEKVYVYGETDRSSATSAAGTAYHKALQLYFNQKKIGGACDIVDMEIAAAEAIEAIPSNNWKIQKTTPTVEECMQKALKTANEFIKNFMAERNVYEDDIEEVLDVEFYFDQFLTINGVDIPLPCHGMIDLVVKTKRNTVAVIDHKGKSVFTDEKEQALLIGPQAITYKKGYESATGKKVDEVWFVENKSSKNKDGSSQLNRFDVVFTPDTERLYEALLYEPLKKMIEAVNNPDYIYTINYSDNLTDMAELFDFWARTMISEVEDFNVPASKQELISQRLKKIRDTTIDVVPPSAIRKFKENAASFIQYDLSSKNMTPSQKIEHILRSFGIIVNVAHQFEGYSSNTYLLEVSAGIKINQVQARRLDIANALDVANVRISSEMVVHEGKSYLAVEFARKRDKVLLFDPAEQTGMKIPLGKDNFNQTVYWDLSNHSTPHALVCGSTGSGKSVCLQNTLEYAMQMNNIDNIVILDPKYEFIKYNYSGDTRIVVVNEIEAIENTMDKLVKHMESLVQSGKRQTTFIIADEFADSVANSRKGNDLKVYEQVVTGITAKGLPKYERKQTGELKSLEENLRILLQKGRSSGFRIMAATQRASVKVITGDAKVNFPVQICFRVAKETDSRVVLDEAGAESLTGMGDGLIKSPEYTQTVRFQAFYKPEKATA